MSLQHQNKIWLACLLLMISIVPLVSFAQEQRNQTNLGDILVRFCNDEAANAKGGTKTLELKADAGQDTQVCMYLSNTGPNDVEVSLNFVDGTVTNDIDQKKACQPEGTKGNFGQYVTMEETVFSLSAGKTIQTSASINFPAGVAGMKYGCVTSQIVGQSESDTGMFKVVSRRANFVDVLVNGRLITQLGIVDLDPSVINLANSKQVLVTQDPFTEEYFAKITVKNDGNVAQQVDMNPEITTRFQESQSGKTISKKVLPGTTETFQFVLDEFIPLWQGNIGLHMTVSHHAIIDFESDAVTEDDKKTTTVNIATSFFIIPWLLIIGILILLLLLRILANKNNGGKEKKSPKVNNSPRPSRTTKATKTTAKKKDNFTKIKGIGNKVQTVLRAAGVNSYEKLASTKVGDIRKILKENNLTKYDPKHRKKQATLAKNGKWDELTSFQKTL